MEVNVPAGAWVQIGDLRLNWTHGYSALVWHDPLGITQRRLETQMTAPAHSSPDDRVLYTPEEAARFLNSNPRTLERWRSEGNGPRFVKIGRRCHYRRADLDAFIEQQVRSHTGQPSRPSHTPASDQPSEAA